MYQDETSRVNRTAEGHRAVLHTAPGEGLLARRPEALLFVPNPADQAEKLLMGFETASAGRELEALAELALEADLDLPPFVAIVFGPVVTLRVFGDLQVETDQPSAPLLSAAACDTWIDHSLHRPGPSVTIRVAGAGCNPLTNAQLGCFSAGGFELRLNGAGQSTQNAQDREKASERQPDTDRPHPDLESSGSLVKLVLDGVFTPDAELVGGPEPCAASVDDPRAETPTLEPPTNVAWTQPARLRAQPGAILRFDDGQRVEVRKPIVMGRNPIRMAESGDLEPLVISGEKVSRAHLMVSIEDDRLLVDDCGSRNGSAILASGASEPMQLLSGTPVAIGEGTKVYLGSRSFTVLETNPEAAR